VTVRDEGPGFDRASVDPARLGVRRSITERVEDWGGSAWVRSAPGGGHHGVPVLARRRSRRTAGQASGGGGDRDRPGPPGRRRGHAIRAGARGYVLKQEEAGELRAAIRAVAAGENWVSPRLAFIFATDDAQDRPALSAQETRTLRLYATGLPIKSVARRLGIGEETAKQYVRRVREKYVQANRAAPAKVDLYHRAVQDGHLRSPSAKAGRYDQAVEDGHLPSQPRQGTPPPSRGNRRYPSSATRYPKA